MAGRDAPTGMMRLAGRHVPAATPVPLAQHDDTALDVVPGHVMRRECYDQLAATSGVRQ